MCYLTRQLSSIVPSVGQPFVACSASPYLSVRQPSDGTGWARHETVNGLRSPESEAKSRDIGETSHPLLLMHAPEILPAGHETTDPPTPMALVPKIRFRDLQAAS